MRIFKYIPIPGYLKAQSKTTIYNQKKFKKESCKKQLYQTIASNGDLKDIDFDEKTKRKYLKELINKGYVIEISKKAYQVKKEVCIEQGDFLTKNYTCGEPVEFTTKYCDIKDAPLPIRKELLRDGFYYDFDEESKVLNYYFIMASRIMAKDPEKYDKAIEIHAYGLNLRFPEISLPSIVELEEKLKEIENESNP